MVVARAKHFENAHFPYHISARCINREWFRIPLDQIWSIFSDHLFLLATGFSVRIHSFVLMPNHFHLIASTPLLNLSASMNYFMRETSREITRASGRINQTYGGPFHRSLITSELYYLHAYKYVYRNPLEAGLAEKVETYKYSTLHGLLGRSKILIPVLDERLFHDPVEHLAWLNRSYREQHRGIIKKALRRARFDFAMDSETRQPHALTQQLS